MISEPDIPDEESRPLAMQHRRASEPNAIDVEGPHVRFKERRGRVTPSPKTEGV